MNSAATVAYVRAMSDSAALVLEFSPGRQRLRVVTRVWY